MEESSSHHHLNHQHGVPRQFLLRGGARTISPKLIVLLALGLAAVLGIQFTNNHASASASTHSSPAHEKDTYHSSLRNSQYLDPLFVREMQEISLNCTLDCCEDQFQDELCVSDNAWISAIPFAVQILLIIVLISFSALFSGLTLGLMSLDKTGLEIVMSGDDPEAARYAKIIYPIRDDGNLLLCTLLLGNVLVNTLLSILMAEYTGGIIGLFSSTFLIVIFGEILPQAFCSRYALRIGSMAVPLVRIIRAIFYPIAKPLAYGLDVALGAELATTYSSAEMMKLLQIHVQQNVIDQETAGAMTGALTYKNMKVKDVMTTMDRTFMLNVDDKLSFETIAKIFKTGYSRIPIYEITRDNIIGLLFVKDLIFIDPEDEVPIRSFVQIFGRGVHVVWPDDTLGDVLAELKKGRTHLALVRDVNNADETQDPYYEVKGIITLEDIIEKIIGDTIVDETDEYVDSTQEVKVERGEGFEWARLRLLDTKIVDDLLSPSEVKAVTAHFRVNFSKTVELLTDTQLSRLVATTPVATLETAKQQLGQDLPKDLLYKKGTPSDVFTLILGGKVTVLVGNEDFRSDVSSWSVLGKSALEKSDFTPDFTAFVSDGPCRCLRISHLDFVSAVDASAIERTAVETQANAKRTTSIGSIDDNSTASSDVPNRREKLLAQLFRKESIDNPIAAELNTDIKEPVIKEEEAGEVKVGRIDSKDADEGNGDANDNEDTTSSTENGGEQAT